MCIRRIMIKKIIMFIVAVLLVILFRGVGYSYTFGEKWDKSDTYLQAAFLAITFVDWQQTRSIARDNWVNEKGEKFSEYNPLLGKHPAPEKVDVMIGLGALLHTIIAMALPKEIEVYEYKIPIRTIWQCVFIVGEITAVGNNYYVGVRIHKW